MMKVFLLILLGSALLLPEAYSQIILSGRVVDAQTHEPLPGATVSIPDLARRTGTGPDGGFTFEKLPAGRFSVQVSFIGYGTEVLKVTLGEQARIDIALSPSLLEMREVVVTASASAGEDRASSVSVESVSRRELMHSASSNLVDAISGVPGVAQISSGPAISKPVIRGLSANRVLTVSNGVRQEEQQWGDEHGLEFDLFSAEKVEILRGPASLLYGSDAMGGVINIIDPIPVADGQVKGELVSRYAGNNGLTGTSLMLEGNRNGFVWRGRGSYRNAHAYRAPEGLVANTGFNETSFSGMAGFNKKWGYSHLNVSSYAGNLGFLEHEHGEEHEDEHADAHSHEAGGTGRHIGLPMQEVRHVRVLLNNNFILGRNQLRANLGFQSNKRKEFEHSAEEAGLDLDLQTWSADLKFFFPGKNGFEPVIGISGNRQENVSGGEELLIPGYVSADAGAFAYLKKELGSLRLNAGVRFDYRNIRGNEMENAEGAVQFSGFENGFSNFSGSVGLAYELSPRLVLKANAGSAFRAPNISELASNGEHHGVERYEIGDPGLIAERSLQFDASIGYTSKIFGLELNGYSNTIYHYIYLRGQTGDSIVHEGEILPVYRYAQANANLSGLEATADLHPRNWLHIGSSFALVRGVNRETGDWLPFIPAMQWRNELKIEPALNSSLLSDTYFSLGLSSTFSQRHVDGAFESASEAYNLVDAGLGTTLQLKGLPVSVFIAASNLFDVGYVSHLSRYRYQGVLDPGRNIRFGLHIPFNLN